MALFGASAAGPARSAIIDIGSNSVRLVVYGGPPRAPTVLFNEKVLAGLGRGLSETGAIEPAGIALAAAALRRFAVLVREMKVPDVRTVATAAVRDASNGGELLSIAGAAGLKVSLLSGEEEAVGAGMGVLSAFSDADGIVGDLGGGSLELVRISGGAVGKRISFPLGVLRLGAIRAKGKGALDQVVGAMIEQAGWRGEGKGLPLYMVGGSWRALARLDMHLQAYPLPVVHGYSLPAPAIERIEAVVGEMPKAALRAIPNISGGRVPTLEHAATLLRVLVRHLGCRTTIASANGLREGLLFQALSEKERAEDPLLAAARAEGRRLCRFAEHGDLLADWIRPLFAGEAPQAERVRHAACLLGDVGWHANPEFRAEYGVEVALHGNWVGIDAAERATLAQALHTSLSGGGDLPEPLPRLADDRMLARARRWGLAIRLGQRLSGGVAGPLERSRLAIEGEVLRLVLADSDAALYGEAVEKRHKALAVAMDLIPGR